MITHVGTQRIAPRRMVLPIITSASKSLAAVHRILLLQPHLPTVHAHSPHGHKSHHRAQIPSKGYLLCHASNCHSWKNPIYSELHPDSRGLSPLQPLPE